VVSDVLATPGWITLGAAHRAVGDGQRCDGDTLTYLWSTGSTCAAGTFQQRELVYAFLHAAGLCGRHLLPNST